MDLKEILQKAVDKKASDIHFVVGRSPIMRIDGILFEMGDDTPIDTHRIRRVLDTLLSDEERSRFEIEKEIGTIFEIKGTSRFRINAYWERGNPGIVARYIPSAIPSMEHLGLPPVAHTLATFRQGLVLITGRKGVGKSTTLASIINHINEYKAENIITFEDPIEYIFPTLKSIIVQRQLGTDFKSFRESLKFVPRHDPDIIVVGEMRDIETMSAVITLAETGHLVFSTLHTCNAAQTINRIIDVFPSHQQEQIRLQLSLTLRGIISQQLLPKIGGGRVAAREILMQTPALSTCIREGKIEQIPTIIQTGGSEGMKTMDKSLLELYKSGCISQETMFEYMVDGYDT
ncbi:MAG: PilT/PilU family type 4a pilus ATPase [bacterium]|nr:PilT/PilU family type 4a pilus ATPase [bacterium]